MSYIILPATGDKGFSINTIVCANPQPSLEQNDFREESNPINQANLSGKRLGSTVVSIGRGTKITLAIASGSNQEDPWYFLKGDGGTVPKDPPEVTKQPTSLTVNDGDIALFTANAIEYDNSQWMINKGSTWEYISGAYSLSLSISATEQMDGYKYRIEFSNQFGISLSNDATLTVIEKGVPLPVVTLHPKDYTGISVDDSFTLTADATGYTSVGWEFKRKDSSFWETVPDENSTTFTHKLDMLDRFQFSAKFTNESGSVYTRACTVYEFVPEGTTDIVITLQPVDATVINGEHGEFTIEGTNISKYQWQVNTSGTWKAGYGSTASTGTFKITAKGKDTGIRCILTDAIGGVLTSDEVMMTVI